MSNESEQEGPKGELFKLFPANHTNAQGKRVRVYQDGKLVGTIPRPNLFISPEIKVFMFMLAETPPRYIQLAIGWVVSEDGWKWEAVFEFSPTGAREELESFPGFIYHIIPEGQP